MNTPAHVIAGLALFTGGDRRDAWRPVVAGSLLPDLPMFAFYAWEKLVRRTDELEIWRTSYFDPAWHDVFDLFNSVPLAALVLAAGLFARRRGTTLLAASLLVHDAIDLALHREDAHRHFHPLSDWRFESPVSYWDPAHHGAWGALLEVGVVVAGSAAVWRRYPHRGIRVALAGACGLYTAGWVAFYGLPP